MRTVVPGLHNSRCLPVLFSIIVLGCDDGQGPSPEPVGGPCPHVHQFPIAANRCAIVAGTVRDSERRPIAGVAITLIRDAAGVPFSANPVLTDVEGRYQLEPSFYSPEDLAPRVSILAHLRGRAESGVEALEASVPVTAIFAIEGSATPIVTADLVIEDPDVWPSAPSGQLVFAHYPDLYLINADGSGQALLHVNSSYDPDPAWTPDGQAVVFSLDGKLRLIDSDGRNLRAFGNDLTGWSPRWAPDGQHLAFRAPYTDGSGMLHSFGAWVTQPDGSDPQRLPTQDDQLCLRTCSDLRGDAFEWYPDSDRLGYLVSTAGTGGNHVVGTYTTRLSDSAIEPIGGLVRVWARDGSSAAVNGSVLEIVDPNGTRIGAIPWGTRPAWSLDGEWLAYASSEFDGQHPTGSHLWIADRNGGRRRRIALDASDPDWQPESGT